MKSKAINGLVLSAIFLFGGLLLGALSQNTAYNYNQPYYSQYNYRYNQPYAYYNYYRPYSRGPQLMPSAECNALYGCRTNYNSYIYIHNALDYTYYTNPQLLEPRYMNNHMRYVKGLWSGSFWY